MRTTSLFLLSLAMLLGACASVELAPGNSDADAKRFAPEPGKSVVYVVHQGGYGAHSRTFQIAINGQAVGSLTGDTYHRVTLSPGKQTVAATTAESERTIELVTEADSVDFVGMTSTIGMSTMRVGSLVRLDSAAGKAAVLQAKLARGLR